MGKFSKGSKYCFVTGVPRLTLARSKGGHWMKYAPADWDCTSSAKPWTRRNSRARVPRTVSRSSSFWGRELPFSEYRDKVNISTRRNDKNKIFDLSDNTYFSHSPLT